MCFRNRGEPQLVARLRLRCGPQLGHGHPVLAEAILDQPFLTGRRASHELALLAVTRDRELGVDLEWHRPDVDLASVARSSFSAAEQQALLALPPADRFIAFYRVWTRKESYIKARGEGLSMPLERFSVSLDGGPEIGFEPDDASEAARWSIRALAIDPGYSAALTITSPCPPLVMRAP